jgi:hypothetical protein
MTAFWVNPPFGVPPTLAARRAPVRALAQPDERTSDGRRWCDQCERRVSGPAAAACQSRFCSAQRTHERRA